jgi:hypothetical protein
MIFHHERKRKKPPMRKLSEEGNGTDTVVLHEALPNKVFGFTVYSEYLSSKREGGGIKSQYDTIKEKGMIGVGCRNVG